ncbi:hypothetical protein [Acetobacter okinawensis]|uniref:hypothetical protein n=1 Tax=Acetobacter okinawensis TaxID=1076594 RepID=UPI00209C720E|nr:hypothetical protein [Acetobacter okinawensis]MCP1212375.1 hypothetical protein [Acetobacter okinawensis]
MPANGKSGRGGRAGARACPAWPYTAVFPLRGSCKDSCGGGPGCKACPKCGVLGVWDRLFGRGSMGFGFNGMILHDLWQGRAVAGQPRVCLVCGQVVHAGAKKGFWAWAGAGYMGIECDGQRAYSYGTKAM